MSLSLSADADASRRRKGGDDEEEEDDDDVRKQREHKVLCQYFCSTAAETLGDDDPHFHKSIFKRSLSRCFGGEFGGATYWSVVASLSFLCTGLLRAYTSPALLSMQNDEYDKSTNLFGTLSRKDAISWIASIPPLTSFLGTIFSAPLLSIWGRRWALFLLSTSATIGWILVGNAGSIKVLLLGRGLTGLASGLATATAPLYISEVVRATAGVKSTSGGGDRRGLLPGIMLSVGILLGFMLAHQIQVWRKLALVISVFPGVLALLCWTIPESPVWLDQSTKYKRNKEIKFDLEMEQVCPSPPPKKSAIIKKPLSEKTGLIPKSYYTSFNLPLYFRVALLMIFQQWSGGNVMIYYLSEILSKKQQQQQQQSNDMSITLSPAASSAAGTTPDSDSESIHQASLIIALVQFIGFFLALPLIDHPRVGRRFLLICSAGLMTLAHLFLGFHFHYLINTPSSSSHSSNYNHSHHHDDLIIRVCSLAALLSCYSIGLGPIPFLFIENPCKNSDASGATTKSSAGFQESSSSSSPYLSSFASLVNHLALFVAVKCFPYLFHMDEHQQPNGSVEMTEHFATGPDVTFWIFAGVCWMAAIFVFYFLPCDRQKQEHLASSS